MRSDEENIYNIQISLPIIGTIAQHEELVQSAVRSLQSSRYQIEIDQQPQQVGYTLQITCTDPEIIDLYLHRMGVDGFTIVPDKHEDYYT